MKTYKLTKPKDYKGLFKISLVDDPAIEVNLMAFNKEIDTFIFKNEAKRIVFAPALIPDKLIFRNNINGEPANVYFTKELIEDLSIDYFRKGIQKTNLNHGEDTDGVFAFESWIVVNKDNDKSKELGFDVPSGTLMMGYKIDNDEVWSEIEQGNYKGLSIEGQFLPVEEEPIKPKIKMNKQSFIKMALDKVKELFSEETANELGNGVYGQSLEVGSIVTDKDGNVMVSTSFEIEGKKYTTDEMGAISAIEEIEVELVEEEPADGGASVEDLKKENEQLKAKIKELEDELLKDEELKLSKEKELTSEIEKFKTEIKELENDILALKEIKKTEPIVEVQLTKAEQVLKQLRKS